jgi:CspA family cold shock protein
MTFGTCKWFNSNKGYDFLKQDAGGPDIFVHITALEDSGLDTLNEGDRVSFTLAPGNGGRSQAANVRLVDGQAPAEAELVPFWAK